MCGMASVFARYERAVTANAKHIYYVQFWLFIRIRFEENQFHRDFLLFIVMTHQQENLSLTIY